MNLLRRASCVFLVLTGLAYGQQRVEDPDIDDYVPVVEDDLVVYTPKQALRLGLRVLTGVQSGFSGQGVVKSESLLEGATGAANRGYHDGYVFLDKRTVVDPSGNQTPITPDGRTNNWGFEETSQVTTDGLIAMNAYTATVLDTSFHQEDPDAMMGVELALDREFGNLFGTRIKWGVVVGFGINQILATNRSTVEARIDRTTDYYSLDGQVAPNAPYTAPTQSGGVDTSVLLRDQPVTRVESSTNSSTAFENYWKLRGAFMTFRAGPTLFFPITQRFSATLSAGAVLVYSGSTFEVTQTFTPDTGDELVLFDSDTGGFVTPGFFVDANLQFAFTDTAGLYLGAVYQSSGDYEQVVTSDDGTSRYVSRVDLSSLQGVRAGVTFRF